uniref:Uncharacterized protein n=1 Tax=Taeniopygia guttata TaxID=59729 RepID=A0A674HHE8_TAEGU
ASPHCNPSYLERNKLSFNSSLHPSRCLVSHDISLQKPIVKLPEAESSNESSCWHLMTAGKQYAANSGLTIEFWRTMNELPQGRQAACYLHLPLLGKCQQESISG